MPSPFDNCNPKARASVEPATYAQITRALIPMLRDRDWRSNDRETLVERARIIEAAIKVMMALPPPPERFGEKINEHLVMPLTKQGASSLINWLSSFPLTRRDTGQNVPEGRYAIPTLDGAVNELAFYKVDRPTEGRWAGYVFVKRLVGPEEQQLSREQSAGVLARIAEVGAQEASATYGHEIGECGICGRRLTNDESRARGIGPVCAVKQGW